MRIRYAYKLDFEDGKTAFVVLNHIKSAEEVQEMHSAKGCVSATFHDRIRTGYRVIPETGEIVETGLSRKNPDEPASPTASSEPKAKKGPKKAKKAQ